MTKDHPVVGVNLQQLLLKNSYLFSENLKVPGKIAVTIDISGKHNPEKDQTLEDIREIFQTPIINRFFNRITRTIGVSRIRLVDRLSL